MAFDTKYRPRAYGDVLGQDASVAILRQFVLEGRGFHQSYVFCGQHGSGKTTLGRILARALLCLDPVDGEPCDKCSSCLTFLEGGVHECFEELDAATKSGKGDLARIIEDVTYSTFSGKRRIYLFDESHRLSKQALDALLKPMEDSIEGTEDKKLVCIFCTTEPEKMRSTIFSRCAPAFVIRAVSPAGIADRLEFVCSSEGVEYEKEALLTIAEVSECHIRDALKTLEGISLLGGVTQKSVSEYLRLGVNDMALDLLECLGEDLAKAMEMATTMAHEVSPSVAYERLAEGALCAYRAHLNIGKIPSQWNVEKVESLSQKGPRLLKISSQFAAPPHRVSRHTLVLDAGTLHHSLVGAPLWGQQIPAPVPEILVSEIVPEPQKISVKSKPDQSGNILHEAVPKPVRSVSETKAHNNGGVWIDPRGIGGGPARSQPSGFLSPETFRQIVQHHLGVGREGGKNLGGV